MVTKGPAKRLTVYVDESDKSADYLTRIKHT